MYCHSELGQNWIITQHRACLYIKFHTLLNQSPPTHKNQKIKGPQSGPHIMTMENVKWRHG